jgi:hypothetical protein
MPHDFKCDQCRNHIRLYVDPVRTTTGLPEVWCLRTTSHRRNLARRMVEVKRYAGVVG